MLQNLISIIVPCYNSQAFLASTIGSVIQQNYSEWELIMVDDGSQDGTWEVIERYMRLDNRIAGYKKANEGTARARNYGFSKSNSEASYLFFLDHDDQLESNALMVMAKYLDSHPEVGLLGCQYRDVSADGRKLETGKRSRWAPGFIFPHELRDDEYETPFVAFFCATGQGPFAMYRRSIYLQTNGWETSFWPHEDTDMFCQMALLSRVHFLPDRLYLKRIHPNQGMSDGARVQRAYGAFRLKWNNLVPKNKNEDEILRTAKKYYYSMHRPCRDLKVAKEVLMELTRQPSFSKLKWFIKLLGSASQGFLLGRFK